ncbi:MAG: matrixin family metalloprotease [bacterium]
MKTKISFVLAVLLFFDSTCLVANSASSQKNNNQAQQQSIQLGNKYAKIAHDAYNDKDYLKAAQNYENAYNQNKIKVYLDNSIVAYTSYAFQLANDKEYDKAINYCNKALSLVPDNKNVKELLSDVYFYRGSDCFYAGELEKAKQDFENALKYAVLKDQIDKAKDSISKIDDFLRKGTSSIPEYKSDSPASVPEITNIIEKRIYGKTFNDVSLLDRISKLELQTLGKIYETEGLVVRVERLKKAVLPEYVAQAQNQQVQNQVYDDTYVKDIIEQSMGRVTVFGKMPITVYIEDSDVKPYKKFYKDAVIEGFKEWEKASENRIKFQIAYNPSEADIRVGWQEDFEDFPWKLDLQKEDLSAEKERMKYRKANAAVQLGSLAAMLAGSLIGVPVIGGVGALGSSFASPILQYKGTKIDKLSPDIKINTKITAEMTDDEAKNKIKQIATHQMGHALGIFGHSPDPNDIMYSNFTVMQLSERDINTIKEIYKSKEPVK